MIRKNNDPLTAALAYYERGWCIIPIRSDTKKPAGKHWKPFQSKRPDRAKLRRWFADRTDYGLAVICGEVSDGLTIRDFDTMVGYEQWQQQHPDLAQTFPTVVTARGRHVYFQSGHCGIVDMGDGELRGGGYCLLPPSRHPSGHEYQWLIHPPGGPLPFVEDVEAAGFLNQGPHATERTERKQEKQGQLMRTGDIVGGGGVSSEELHVDDFSKLPQPIQTAILESMPTGPGQRHKRAFELARGIKSIDWLADADLNDLEPYVRWWHKLALPNISTKPFEETWLDFILGWPKVKFPKGSEPMVALFERAKTSSLPACAERYETETIRLLVALCRESAASTP